MLRLIWIFTGLSGAVAVIAGAAASHWMAGGAYEAMIPRVQLAATYQIFHTLALLALGVLYAHEPRRLVALAAGLFMLGILAFSGSLYGLSFFSAPWLGPVTPLGGFAWIAGWLSLCALAFPSMRRARGGYPD